MNRCSAKSKEMSQMLDFCLLQGSRRIETESLSLVFPLLFYDFGIHLLVKGVERGLVL